MKTIGSGNGILALRKEMDRIFDRIWDRDWTDLTQLGDNWLPALDVVENPTELVVTVDVPGLEAKDVHVTVRENLLIIRGEKRTESERKDEKTYRLERQYGAFTRHIALPVAVDSTKVAAKVHNGVLTINMPKTPAAKGQEVPVLAS
ncbi:MAG: Hsp20/alpha crystallin family protein [bacterium]